jgi:site-specific DNA-methyltransferase (adenine-specific)
MTYHLHHGDCLDILPTLPSDRYAIVTDPPYGTGGWRRTASGAGSNPSGSLVIEAWDDGAVEWIGVLPAVVIASFWPSCSAMRFLTRAHEANYTKHRALYMRKRDPKPMPGGRTRWSVEPIWVLSSDGFVLHGGDDVIEASTPRLGRDRHATGHPYQKPLKVMEWIISKLPDDLTIVDPFMGSGTTGHACVNLRRRFIGIERDAGYFKIAQERIADAADPLRHMVSAADAA